MATFQNVEDLFDSDTKHDSNLKKRGSRNKANNEEYIEGEELKLDDDEILILKDIHMGDQ